MDFYEMRALELKTAQTQRYLENMDQKPRTYFWDCYETYITDVIRANRRMSKTYLQHQN